MSGIQAAILGAIAGFTIFLGLPVARVEGISPRIRGFLSVMSAGILLFLFWVVLNASIEKIEAALSAAQIDGSWGAFLLRVAMVIGGLAIGALGLGWLEGKVLVRPVPPIAGGSTGELVSSMTTLIDDTDRRRRALSLGMMIAMAIGLHNFSEGLAIGVSARSGDVALAGTLILGFRPAQRDGGVRDRRAARRHPSELGLVVHGRRDRRRSDLPRHPHRLPRDIGRAGARVLRAGRRRHPLRGRADLGTGTAALLEPVRLDRTRRRIRARPSDRSRDRRGRRLRRCGTTRGDAEARSLSRVTSRPTIVLSKPRPRKGDGLRTRWGASPTRTAHPRPRSRVGGAGGLPPRKTSRSIPRHLSGVPTRNREGSLAQMTEPLSTDPTEAEGYRDGTGIDLTVPAVPLPLEDRRPSEWPSRSDPSLPGPSGDSLVPNRHTRVMSGSDPDIS